MYELGLFDVNISAFYLTILSFVQFMRVAPPEAVFCSVKASNFVGIVASFTRYSRVVLPMYVLGVTPLWCVLLAEMKVQLTRFV